MNVKTCTKCKIEKPLTEFHRANSTKDGHRYWCKECCKEYNKVYSKTAIGIYKQIKSRQTFFKKHGDPRCKPVTITQDEFIDWYDSLEKECAYCDIPEEDFILIKMRYGSRTERLTIDCMDNRVGYAEDNIVLACERCNQIKSNLLTFDEMREFAQKYIKPKWIALKNGVGDKSLYLTHY